MADELFTLAAATTGTPASAPFGRVLTAMVTPFHDDGTLDLDGAAALTEDLIERGCDGLVLSGTTGESPTTSDSEKDALLRTVLDAAKGRAKVVAGVGTYDTHHTIELARSAEKAGAHGLLVVTPYYSRPPQEGVRRHFTAVADATDLPVMLYDIPGRSVVPIATDTLFRVAEHERIVAVKDAKGDIFASSEVMARTGLAYYSGEDALNLALLTHGAVGVVSVVAHVAAREYSQMTRAIDSGDLVRALRLHRQLIPAVRAIMTRTQGAIMVKAAVHASGLIASRQMRSPLIPATDEQVAQMRTDLAEAGLL
ncbi:4-hydroxy-tetrahydrodipicolinate synthase [Actinobacteria bacterium YIM 96077]|uniref:4-hydroxy-tetrahydrodipicolinate synthase n=1 Tax=Phytoactinopolyspora halophila TaxID=1981511 RepID=A0A329R0G0_9ACTN|nr:4-hydroxy-tetrahydrodipicolinate synthase [Phytoactinopolyspora halophila]AYY12798.1 4-hydroxy-tetrahydrodipicolinate synthase [Actinobacteria bacterium YIM 96077]RAW16408.1 4-hydroxy-tetrahydrodipicolinate synthase [Phytoactinopolyspora halophila]